VLVPLDWQISQAIQKVPRDIVPEMPDRIIAATALTLSVSLVTRDLKIQAADLKTIW
jgi:predicted nucleic acid-binding protein